MLKLRDSFLRFFLDSLSLMISNRFSFYFFRTAISFSRQFKRFANTFLDIFKLYYHCTALEFGISYSPFLAPVATKGLFCQWNNWRQKHRRALTKTEISFSGYFIVPFKTNLSFHYFRCLLEVFFILDICLSTQNFLFYIHIF